MFELQVEDGNITNNTKHKKLHSARKTTHKRRDEEKAQNSIQGTKH
jgi:hypothetical protein